MKFYTKLGYFIVIFLVTVYGSMELAYGQGIPNGLAGEKSASMLEAFVGNYMGIDQLENYLISLMMAIGLAIIIAFHPLTFGKKEDLNEIEAPKSMLFYAMIGSLVGATVADYGAELGFIFFGLGGLMRFRTTTGSSTQTGRLILVALIGLCCGLKMLYIATISTIVAWILIYILERKNLYHIEVKGLDKKLFPESVEAYRNALKQLKCNIIVEKKNMSKLKVGFIFDSPAKLRREGIENSLNAQISQDHHGSIDWEVGYK